MKNFHNAKNLIGCFMFASGLSLLTISCNQQSKDPEKVAEKQNDASLAASDNKDLEKDAKFLVEAAEINMEEIQLGQLAQQKSSTQHVQELGKMMENDHTKNLEDVKALAARKSIVIPEALSKDGQDDYKKLNEKTGKDFDKDYCEMMVKGHKDAIDKFEKASSDCKDADIRSFATNTIPKLRAHLDHSTDCKEKCKKSDTKS
jgi:putative membrane protein